jgi:hypothetical protein
MLNCFRPATLEDLRGSHIKIPAINTSPVAPARVFYFGSIKSQSQKRVTPVATLSRCLVEAEAQGGAPPAVEGVQLGALLGRGSFGSVHIGLWKGLKVAVKLSLKE